MNFEALCKKAGIDQAVWYRNGMNPRPQPDNSLAHQLVRFAALVIEAHDDECAKSPTLLAAARAVDRDIEMTGSVSVGSIEQLRDALATVGLS